MAISVIVVIVLLRVVCTFVDGNRRPMETHVLLCWLALLLVSVAQNQVVGT